MDSPIVSISLPILFPYIIIGICVYSGLTHLLIYSRNPREMIHGVFSTMCFLIAWVAFSSSHLYQSTTVEESSFYLKSLVGGGQVFFIFFLWFVGLYTGFLPKRTLIGISLLHILVITLNLTSSGSVLFSEIHSVSEIALPSGSKIWMVYDYDISPTISLFFVSYLVNFAFDAVACYKFYRKGAGLSGHLLAISLFLFIGSVTHDILMSFSIPLTPVMWIEYGFLPVIVLMSLKISRDYYRQESLESEDKYRRLVEGLERDYFVYSKTPDGKYDYLSPSVEQLFGRKISEMAGENWRRFLDLPQSLEKGNEAEETCRRGDRPPPFEVELTGPDGSAQVIEIQERPVLDSTGKVTSIEGIGKDITSTKQTEKDLTSARDSLRQINLRLEERIQERTQELTEINSRLLDEKVFSDSLLESLPGIFYLIRLDGTFLRWNKKFEEVSGYSEEEMGQIRNTILFLEEDLPALEEVMGRIFQGKTGTLECPFVPKDGSTIPYFFTGERVRLEGEDLLIGMGIDVTDKAKAEEEFLRAHQLLNLHIENSPLGLIGWNKDFRIEQWSAKAEEIFGWSEAEVMGKHWNEIALVSEEDLEQIRRVAEELTSGEVRSKTTTNRNLRKDGKLIHCEWYSSVVLDVDGTVASILSLIHDVTERAKIEEELSQHREHLERLVEERTRALAKVQEEMVQREKLATLGQVMATISHELRNPLGTIRGSFYTVGERLQQRGIVDLDRAMARIDRNLKRCDRIIDELLDFVRNRSIDRSRVRLGPLLEETVQDYIFPREIEFRYHPNGSDPWVRLDEERFRRCLINLLNNSCEAVEKAIAIDPQRKGKVEMEVSHPHEDTIEIRIKDSGSGIPNDLREKIFEPLFSTKNFGIGLGLHIVRSLMEQHEGGIEVEESSDLGTTLRLWLPVVD